MRTLILIITLALSALASTGAGAMVLDRVDATAPMAMADDMGAPCPSCPDHAMPGARMDQLSCCDCAACGVIAAAAPLSEVSSRLPRLSVVVQATQNLPLGHIEAHDPPPPRA